MSHEDILRRALAAYLRSGAADPAFRQPATELCRVEALGGLTYAVIRNVEGLLAVYRVRNDGMLRRMVRPPRALGD
ncbi:hypothetical protein H0K60_004462 [Salmonella enterica]|nr:hypothetical protein [Salmonella enterica]EFR2649706.1 hypothetical protein [Salmonella enterica]EFS1408055.1 hypothetical protein [Salmonella enterica]EHQ8162502.1 hypothetical protein [Salmonella enterica]EJZ9218155.1 hypothetical protein [Salmonella enterica]